MTGSEVEDVMTMQRTVADVMTRAVITVRATTPFKEIVWHMRSRDVSAVPVLDAEDRVIGVVSEADLLLKEERLDLSLPPLFERRRRRKERAKAAAEAAAQLMTAPPVTIGAASTVSEAARTMHRAAVKRLPVVDGGGRLVGIVSRGDLLKVFLRTDGEIRAEVEDALGLPLRVHPSAILVDVCDGVVRLSGRVKRRSEIALAEADARRVDGVVAVDCVLDYDLDDESIAWPGPAYLMGP